jgi:hypothetical protein
MEAGIFIAASVAAAAYMGFIKHRRSAASVKLSEEFRPIEAAPFVGNAEAGRPAHVEHFRVAQLLDHFPGATVYDR